MKQRAAIIALAALAAPALAQSTPFQHLLESGMNVAAEKAGWVWTDAKQGFNAVGAGSGFGVSLDAEAGKTYLLAAACAAPCTRVGLMLMTPEQQPVGEIVWGAKAGDIQLATLAYTADATRNLTVVAAIAECPEATCPGGASVYATRSE